MYSFSSSYPKITLHILHAVPHSFPEVLMKRTCLTFKSLFSWWSFSLFLWPKCLIKGRYCKEKLDANQSQGSKGTRLKIFLQKYDFSKQCCLPLINASSYIPCVPLKWRNHISTRVTNTVSCWKGTKEINISHCGEESLINSKTVPCHICYLVWYKSQGKSNQLFCLLSNQVKYISNALLVHMFTKGRFSSCRE